MSLFFPVILLEISAGAFWHPNQLCDKTELFANESPAKPVSPGKQLPTDMMLARILGPGASSSELPGELGQI